MTLTAASDGLPDIREADKRLWDVAELSAFLGVPVSTLYRWRRYRCGPPGHRVGHHLRYVPDEVLDWVRAQA